MLSRKQQWKDATLRLIAKNPAKVREMLIERDRQIEELRERLDLATRLLSDARDYGEFHDDGRELVDDIEAFLEEAARD
jgi:hypothetical protein